MKNAGLIYFRKLKSGGWELLEEWWVETGIKGNAARIHNKSNGAVLVELGQDGRLIISASYRWDGASGPVIDRKANMRAGLAHDALYQLHRASKLGLDLSHESDRVYRELYVSCGGWGWVGWLDYWGLRIGAGHARRPQREVEDKRRAA